MKNHEFSKISIFPKIILMVAWGIGGMRARASTVPGGTRGVCAPSDDLSLIKIFLKFKIFENFKKSEIFKKSENFGKSEILIFSLENV